jgi:hypothetical protein
LLLLLMMMLLLLLVVSHSTGLGGRGRDNGFTV